MGFVWWVIIAAYVRLKRIPTLEFCLSLLRELQLIREPHKEDREVRAHIQLVWNARPNIQCLTRLSIGIIV